MVFFFFNLSFKGASTVKKKAPPTKASALPEEGHRAFPAKDEDPAVPWYQQIPRHELDKLIAQHERDQKLLKEALGPKPPPAFGPKARRLLAAELKAFGLDAGPWFVRSKRQGVTWCQALILPLYLYRRCPPRNKQWKNGYDEQVWARWAAKNPDEAREFFDEYRLSGFSDKPQWKHD